jgi:hypothetical protein
MQLTGDYKNHNAQPFIIVIIILASQHLCFTSTNLGIAVFDMDTVQFQNDRLHVP